MKEDKNNEIKPFRDAIDIIDSKIITLLADRRNQIIELAKIKKRLNIPIFHSDREKSLITKLRFQADEQGVDPEFIEKLYYDIIEYSRFIQVHIIKG